MDFLAPFHPQIIHTPIVLLIVGLLFEIVGHVTRQEWWRKAAVVMLLLGTLGAGAAVLSGGPAGDAAERAGAPERAVDAHEAAAMLTLWLAIAALVVRTAATALHRGRALASGVALVLWLAAAVSVGVTGYRGGKLVYEHGAGVHLGPASAAPAGSAKPGEPTRAPAGDKD